MITSHFANIFLIMITNIRQDMLKIFFKLVLLFLRKTSSYYKKFARVCEPNSDDISSFSHLLDNMLLRVFLRIVTYLGSVFVLICGLLVKETNAVHSFYIKNLLAADFLMCLYLFMITGHDAAFRDQYIHHDVEWRHSWQCTLAGMLGTISSEASIFIMTLITADRYMSIEYPLMHCRRSMFFAVSSIVACWTMATTLSVFPLLNLGFGEEYYENSNTCLPLHFQRTFSEEWDYSMVIFCGLNSLTFAFMVCSFTFMLITMIPRPSQQQQDHILAKRFAFIVGAKMMCWLPIIVIKIMSVSGMLIDPELFGWVAVFLLSLNSILNPALWILTKKLFKDPFYRIAYTWRVVASRPESFGIPMTNFSRRLSRNNSAPVITSETTV